MAMATASNWTFNFLISFFTPFITGVIDFRYGYVFAACCFAGAVVVYIFLCESQGRTLEEIDTMYILKVVPWKSAKWRPEEEDLNVSTEAAAERRGVGEGEPASVAQ
jgi:MFS transporter, SP family, sugar:H+ symporter